MTTLRESQPPRAGYRWDIPPVQGSLFPRKYDLFGVQVSATTYDEIVESVIDAASLRVSAIVDFMPVSVLVSAARDARFREAANQFEVVCPDGQPVRWLLNALHKTRLRDVVCGSETMLRLCAAAQREGISIYLYGSTPRVLEKLQRNLASQFPRLTIAGVESPPFRKLTPEEDAAAVQRINASGAGLVFLGIGSPRQEQFAWEHRRVLRAVQLCVGAAFDFHAGSKRRAPVWMRRCGLEWLFRFVCEPRRLWRRYLVTNTLFCLLVLRYTGARLVAGAGGLVVARGS